MSYLLDHWRGRLPLKTALWVNMIGLLIVLTVAEYYFFARLTVFPDSLVRNTLISLLITRLIIYVWQLLGLFRAIEQDFIAHRNSLKTTGLQGIALLTLLFTFVYCLEVIQGALFYTRQLETDAEQSDQPRFQIKVDELQQQLVIIGSLDIGISQTVLSTLESHPKIQSVRLQSVGGHLYEGRGLAKLFTRFGLDTYVYGECSSACTTAYIGGSQRFLGAEGKLGFHQYKLESSQHRKMVPFYDMSVEQKHDRELFKARGIDPSFLLRMFDQPADRMWFPDHAQLLDARVVNFLVSSIEEKPKPLLQ